MSGSPKASNKRGPAGFTKRVSVEIMSCSKREHVDGVGGPGRVRAATGIGSKSRLPVGCRRYQAKSAIGLPSPIKEGADHPAPRIPLRQRRHGIGRVVFEEGHKIVQ